MQFIVFIALIFSFSEGQIWYSGDLAFLGTQTARRIDLSNPVCSLSTTPTAFQTFSFDVTSTSFYYITGLFQFPNYAQIQLYSAPFSSANPCANLVIANASRSDTPTPHLQFIQYLSQGTYYVVVTSTTTFTQGLFVVHVDRANFNVATSTNDNWWNAPIQQDPINSQYCQDSTTSVPYTTITFTPNTTGFYDLVFFGYNSSYSTMDISIGIYNSSQLPFVGTGTSSSPVSGCSTNNFIYGVTSLQADITSLFQSGYSTAVALNIQLQVGTTYTAVIGAYSVSGRTGNFGMFIRPTVVDYINNQKIFSTPIVNGDVQTFSCNISGYQQYWDANWFTAQNNIYIFAGISASFTQVQCLYSGFNLGVPPITCPTGESQFLRCGDALGEGPIAISTLIPGENYTFISIPFANSNSFPGGSYIAYKYTGELIGGISVTTGGFFTTDAMTSGIISTGEVTSGLITTGIAVNSITTGMSNTICMPECSSSCGNLPVSSCICNSQGGVASVTCASADSGIVLSALMGLTIFCTSFL